MGKVDLSLVKAGDFVHLIEGQRIEIESVGRCHAINGYRIKYHPSFGSTSASYKQNGTLLEGRTHPFDIIEVESK